MSNAAARAAVRRSPARRHWAEHVLLPAEMAGRELGRRRTALGLLTLLPLVFYAASRSDTDYAPVLGGIAMAFSISGAAIFCVMSSRRLDTRLVLSGYRPRELMIGRLLLLESLGALVALVFSGVIVLGSNPGDPGELLAGVFLVTLCAVPFGLAVGALVPSELESVLILIGVVGVQLTLSVSNPGREVPALLGRPAAAQPVRRRGRRDDVADHRRVPVRGRAVRDRVLGGQPPLRERRALTSRTARTSCVDGAGRGHPGPCAWRDSTPSACWAPIWEALGRHGAS